LRVLVVNAQNSLIAMSDCRVFAADSDIEQVFYAGFYRGLGDQQSLSPAKHAAVAAAADDFRAMYQHGWVGGTVFLTRAETVFIPAAARRPGRDEALAFRVPLTEVLALELERGVLRDTITIRTNRGGGLKLRCFMGRRFGARIEQACVERLVEIYAGGLRPQMA
jgi:hypothetical protein